MTDVTPHKTANPVESTRKVKATLIVTKTIHRPGSSPEQPLGKLMKCVAEAIVVNHSIVQGVNIAFLEGHRAVHSFSVDYQQLTPAIECLQQIRADILKETDDPKIRVGPFVDGGEA